MMDFARDRFGTDTTYAHTVAFLVDEIVSGQLQLSREAIAVGAPPWFVQRLAMETDALVAHLGGGMEMLYLAETPVVGVPVLDRQPLGRFIVQDLLEGYCYRLSFYCHSQIDPVRWRSLSLAVSDGLYVDVALQLAAMDP
jgi:hypothetical protein